MYRHSSYHIGQFEVIKLGRENGPGIEVIPAKGGILNQIFLGEEGVPLLDSLNDEKEIEENLRFKQALLFPFPNRLKDGLYSVNNTQYSFPINEPERNNALHGLVYDQEFVITELDLTDQFGRIELTYIHHGQNEAYPFPFTLRVTYTINESSFEVGFKIENTGSGELPYGLGWHPYFKTDQIAKIFAPTAQLQMVNQRLLPTGEEQTYNFGSELRELTENLDNAFRVPDSQSVDLTLGDFKNKRLSLKADASFRFFQIYNPAKNVIAVEPVTANINALNTGDALLRLPGGELKEHRIELLLLAE